ncbi:Receptor-binding cancer antigen expressed on SiSo cells [Liparis tanakae]|uniref:Receptor-binding cancer antigen expressed on SiSo cells n=1 Tax=Liparis tanakae TaxID=230148 RepID=A0A4Z2H6I2_9TELE|nr:Receptor-binding cancer antigen expressed on SiSo cells [Liparis tanakae]
MTDLVLYLHVNLRTGRGRKLSGDQITLPTTVDFSSSVPKQAEVEEWSSWDEDAPTSIKIEGGNGNVSPTGEMDEEPDYFKDMTPTIRKTQKIVLKKREPLNYLVPDGSAGFSSRLAASQDMMTFSPPSGELGEMETWQEDSNAWEDESDAAWETELVLRQQKMAEREKRSMEQQKKKVEKEVQRMMKKDQKIAVKLSRSECNPMMQQPRMSAAMLYTGALPSTPCREYSQATVGSTGAATATRSTRKLLLQ